jgi:hypothetical protein
MAVTRTFPSVTADLQGRNKQVTREEHGIVFDPPEGTTGTAKGRTPLAACTVRFVYDSAQAGLEMPW